MAEALKGTTGNVKAMTAALDEIQIAVKKLPLEEAMAVLSSSLVNKAVDYTISREEFQANLMRTFDKLRKARMS